MNWNICKSKRYRWRGLRSPAHSVGGGVKFGKRRWAVVSVAVAPSARVAEVGWILVELETLFGDSSSPTQMREGLNEYAYLPVLHHEG